MKKKRKNFCIRLRKSREYRYKFLIDISNPGDDKFDPAKWCEVVFAALLHGAKFYHAKFPILNFILFNFYKVNVNQCKGNI